METVVFTNLVPIGIQAVEKFNFWNLLRVVKPQVLGLGQPFLQVEWWSFLQHLPGWFTRERGKRSRK